jgi:AcrR family transcriptional regulator
MCPSDSPASNSSGRADEIAAAARVLLEEQGESGLSMRNVAAAIGVRAPSLYEHITDKRALEDAIIADGMREQGDRLAAAASKGGDPLTALGAAWRAWALEHPHLYRLINARDLNRQSTAVAEAEFYAGAAIRSLTRGDAAAALVIWSFAHGMVMLELNQRFPPAVDVDELWRLGLESLAHLLPSR